MAKLGRRGNREGSVFHRADGRWVAVVTLPDGKRKYAYAKTREKAGEKLTQLLKARLDGLAMPSERLTVRKLAADWLESIRSSVRDRTFESYSGLLRKHLLPRLGSVAVARLQPGHLERAYAEMIAAGVAPKTARNAHGVMHAMLEKAERWNVVTRNVARLVDIPRVPRRQMTVLSTDEAKRLMDACAGHRLEALFVTALMSGARSGELLALTWDRLDLEARTMRITHTLQHTPRGSMLIEPKTSQSRRVVPLPHVAADALRRHRARQAAEALKLGPAWQNTMNLVFTREDGSPLHRNGVLRYFRPLLAKAGLPETVRFHDLRHAAASLALSRGLPVPLVAQTLGHSTPATTMKIYAHALPTTERQVADAFEVMFGGK